MGHGGCDLAGAGRHVGGCELVHQAGDTVGGLGVGVFYWLGDDSLNAQATDDFIARRIADVMRFEKFKAQVNSNAFLRPVTAPLNRLLSHVRAPRGCRRWTCREAGPGDAGVSRMRVIEISAPGGPEVLVRASGTCRCRGTDRYW